MSLKNIFSSFSKKNNNKDTSLKNTDVIVAGRQLPNGDELTVGIDVEDFKNDIVSEVPVPDLSEAVSSAWSIDGITTHFQKGVSTISNGASVSSTFIYGELFRLDCKVKVASFDTRINSLNTSYTDSEMHCAIYKLNVDTGLFELAIEQPQPFDLASATGTTGWNKVSLVTPVSSGGSGAVSYNSNDQMSLGGYNATGNQQTGFKTFKANTSVYPTFTYLNPMPATLNPADFIPSTSNSIMKFFNTITV
jgi:hypothetical protein